MINKRLKGGSKLKQGWILNWEEKQIGKNSPLPGIEPGSPA